MEITILCNSEVKALCRQLISNNIVCTTELCLVSVGEEIRSHKLNLL